MFLTVIVYKELSSLKSNKAHGDDGMESLMLKQLANQLKGVLTLIYNRSMSESKISDDSKTKCNTNFSKR